MIKYKFLFVNGYYEYKLASDLESAAWEAYELSRTLQLQLKDIIPCHETQENLSE